MFTFEKIVFKHPFKDYVRDVVEYVIVANNKVLFGRYSKSMNDFYNQAHTKTVLEKSNDLDYMLELLQKCYWPMTENEWVDYVEEKFKPETRERHIKGFIGSRYFYCQPIDRRSVKQSNSILLRFLSKCSKNLNADENIESVKYDIECILFDIKNSYKSNAA